VNSLRQLAVQLDLSHATVSAALRGLPGVKTATRLRVMQAAGAAPVGHVANAVMLHARLNTGMTLLEILPHTRSLGQKLSDPPAEAFAWTDANGDRVEVTLVNGRLAQWQLIRAAAEAEVQAPAQPGA
jgi:hypothetical protein